MKTFTLALAVLSAGRVLAQPPAPLPGQGLTQHPFLYCGQWDTRKPVQTIFLARGGKVVWTHAIPSKNELSDCTLLSNGNVMFARKGGATEVTPDKKVVWALREWTDPDLGPASTIQLLDEPGKVEDGDLQR